MIQAQVINYILTNKDSSLIVLNNLTDDHFSDYKKEFNFILGHLDRYGNIPDKETFVASFIDFDVIQVTETPQYLITELYRDYKKRRLGEIFTKVKTLVMTGKVEEALQIYQQEAETIYEGSSLESIDILKDTSRYDAFVERTQDFDKFYVTTGFKEIDSVIGGWDRREELATIVARTNYGKSWILLKAASAAAKQGLNVGIYSGEMSDRKVGYRLDTLIGNIPNAGLVRGNIGIQVQYKKYMEELPNMVEGSIKVVTPNMINGPANVNALRVFIEKEKLDILFIDQLSLLEDQRRGRTAVDKASNISKDLKNLQVMVQIPIVSVSQQNRTKTDSGDVDTTQIAQSDRIGQDSTCILFLEKKEETMKIHLVKSRDSENGKTFTYKVDLNKGVFNYIPEGDSDIVSGSSSNQYTFDFDSDEDEEISALFALNKQTNDDSEIF